MDHTPTCVKELMTALRVIQKCACTESVETGCKFVQDMMDKVDCSLQDLISDVERSCKVYNEQMSR